MARKGDRKPERQLENLDSTVVAIPLLELMKKTSAGTGIDVLVEVNLLHSEGREATNRRVVRMVKACGGHLHRKLAEDTDQYVFARLTARQIRELAKVNEAERTPRKAGSEGVEPMRQQSTRWLRPIYKIWPDFEVDMLLTESVSTVKADAARAAFAAGGRGVVWAVIDSGIDGTHPHFKRHGNLELRAPLSHQDFSGDTPFAVAPGDLEDEHGHGTHVAGIIAGEAEETSERGPFAVVHCRNEEGREYTEVEEVAKIRGIAPECKILSLRVANREGKMRARNLIAALGYVRRVNGDGRLPHVHGVNISLGHEFDPEWFACGQSPLCVEVDRLVRTGTVVVVAAGNGGYGTADTLFKGRIQKGLEGTIRDPANAGLAITVGATHRDMPHVYGVSYFSAKGPTGDGRLKPDVVAPGERIISAAAKVKRKRLGCSARQNILYCEDSGTSMAAPHVSGCIAAFLSIRREFKSQPERVKEIFVSTATDLGRERYYQGSGLVDLMRAIQSV